ncbi:hypothetical protein N0345_17880, partial [Pseudomonas aeruginosa]|nr:hypothetical protein [Pseudomonas aeruginosa]MCS9269721.1 hypothetical protein [Pseudomonas aeruginosa]
NSTTGYHLRWPKKNSTHCPGWVDHYKANLDPLDDEPVELNFPDYPILLYINATTRSSAIEGVIKKGACFKLLRHEMF